MKQIAASASALAAIAAVPAGAQAVVLTAGLTRPSAQWGEVYLVEIVLPRGYPHPTEYHCPALDSDTGQVSDADSICIGGSIIYREGRVRLVIAADGGHSLLPGKIRVKGIGGHAVRSVGGGRFIAVLERTDSGYFWMPYQEKMSRGRACLNKDVIKAFAIRFPDPPARADERDECYDIR